MNKFMNEALKEAKKAYKKDEVPVGCVIVKDNKIIARAHNLKMKEQSVISHAEINAIKKASKKLKEMYLIDCDMYVTLEPCTMCSGAIIHSRLRKVYFGAYDNKTGAIVSKSQILDQDFHNHHVLYEGNIMQDECSKILKEYFKEKREKHHGL
ncbi:MAG: tRNA adenosine(34) deaminase TadA [Bacilli bacterium]|nr:tRNA adenosine(34) deaminase TadA [Bacilli bacterium]